MKTLKLTIFIIITFMLISTVTASDLSLNACKDDGSFSFNFQSTGNEKIYVDDVKILAISPSGKILDITNKGEWNAYNRISEYNPGNLFQSDEAVLNEQGKYRVELNYKSYVSFDEYSLKTKEKEVSCPGLKFSCEILDISINRCYNQDGSFKADLTMKGLKPSTVPGAKYIDTIEGIDYLIDAEKSYEEVEGNYRIKGSLPKGYQLIHKGGDNYLLQFDFRDNVVNYLRVAYTDDDYYEYTFELDECYTRRNELPGSLSDYERCEILSSKEEASLTGQVVKEIEEEPQQEKAQEDQPQEQENIIDNYVPVLIIAGAIILAAIIGAYIIKKKK